MNALKLKIILTISTFIKNSTLIKSKQSVTSYEIIKFDNVQMKVLKRIITMMAKP